VAELRRELDRLRAELRAIDEAAGVTARVDQTQLRLREATTELRADLRNRVLECVECATESDGWAVGWEAHLTIDDEVAVYCPPCAEGEFGGDDAS
jgi:hypothetical protein